MGNMKQILDMVFFGIWDRSITVGYCILAVFLLRFLLQRLPRKYLYMLWLIVAFRLLCPVSINTQFGLFHRETSAERMPVLTEEMAEEEQGFVQEPKIWAGSASEEQQVGIGEERQKSSNLRSYLREIVYVVRRGQLLESGMWRLGTYVWITGVLVFAMYFAFSTIKLQVRVRRAVRMKGGSLCSIYECDEWSSPFVMGVFRPRIYLPWGLTQEELEMVLLHEEAHIRRKDHLVKYLSFVLLALYWFHPLVWAAWAGMCRDMEMSCDEKVLERLGGDRRKEYSRTLLALASERPVSVRMPLAFGEQDVKKRIRHVLDYRKPAFWAGGVAIAVLLVSLLFLGTNRTSDIEEAKISDEPSVWEYAGALYEARNPYVGDISADGRLLGVISEVYPDLLTSKIPFRTELQTSKEPYEFHFLLEMEPPEDDLEQELAKLDLNVTAALMLALTDNLGIVRWSYVSPEGEVLLEGGSVDAAEAAKWCGADKIKEFAESEEKVQWLLDRIEGLYIRPWDSNLPFVTWYAGISAESYEQAVPIGEAAYEGRGETDPCMFILAQTEDGTVTVYGCSSTRLGDRGLTLVYRASDEEEAHSIFMDEKYWGGRLSESRTEVYKTDLDQDGEEEIVLLRENHEGERKQTVFGVTADGELEALEESEADDITEKRTDV